MRTSSGLTLLELVAVLSILVAVSALLVPLFGGTIQNANEVVTTRSLIHVQEALSEYWGDTKHVTMDGIVTVATESNRLHIDWLFANPVTGDETWDFSANTQIGWRGPYLSTSTGDQVTAGSPYLIDAWNQAVIVQDVDPNAALRDVRIVSAGPDGTITTPDSVPTSSLTAAQVGDDIYVATTLR